MWALGRFGRMGMKMRRWMIITAIVLFSVSCAAKKGFNRGEMESALRAGSPTFVSSGLTVEQIERLQPQISLPVKLAVAPPMVSTRYWGYGRDLSSWSPEESKEIAGWEEPLKKAGVISELNIIPSMLVEECRPDDPGCGLRARRAAAARVQADALLMTSVVTAVDEYTNAASMLDITVVGLWVAPGHECDALTIVEGAMLDNRNEYLYAFARGEAEQHLIRPLMYADTWKAARPSRFEALRAFGREFIKQASQLKSK